MEEATKTDRESQFTALQVVVAAIATTLKDDPKFQSNLALFSDLANSPIPEKDKAKVKLSIKRLTGI
ncbi:TPA: hypothetical protein ACKQCJ_000544 [Stenotrophomonas maltophilia]